MDFRLTDEQRAIQQAVRETGRVFPDLSGAARTLHSAPRVGGRLYARDLTPCS